jgi:hypothetical protein
MTQTGHEVLDRTIPWSSTSSEGQCKIEGFWGKLATKGSQDRYISLNADLRGELQRSEIPLSFSQAFDIRYRTSALFHLRSCSVKRLTAHVSLRCKTR